MIFSYQKYTVFLMPMVVSYPVIKYKMMASEGVIIVTVSQDFRTIPT